MSELNDDLNDECLNVCIYIYMYKEKLFMSEDYSCSSFNNNAQSDKQLTNYLSVRHLHNRIFFHFYTAFLQTS